MPDLQFSAAAQQWVVMVLVWVGFGTLAGLLAKALVPGREPGGAVGILVVGILGSAIGPLTLSLVLKARDFNPVSPLGFLAATAGAFVLLLVYRVAVACFWSHQEDEV